MVSHIWGHNWWIWRMRSDETGCRWEKWTYIDDCDTVQDALRQAREHIEHCGI